MSVDTMTDDHEQRMLRKLLHLKSYETPEHARMTRCRQNIMREIRTAKANRRPSIGEIIENYVPWFFAEPRYGIALLFVAFAALQYVGVNARNSTRSTGIYTSTGDLAAYESMSSSATNQVYYPVMPKDYQLFNEQPPSDKIMMVERLIRK